MLSPLRIATTLLGALFALQGVAWLVDPARVAATLGMPLLDGVGRSTQIGDFASFFATGGITMILGSRPGRGRLLYVPALLFVLAATGRTLAWALHGAEFAATFVVVELAMGGLLVATAQRADEGTRESLVR
jgi:hypothetical protein